MDLSVVNIDSMKPKQALQIENIQQNWIKQPIHTRSLTLITLDWLSQLIFFNLLFDIGLGIDQFIFQKIWSWSHKLDGFNRHPSATWSLSERLIEFDHQAMRTRAGNPRRCPPTEIRRNSQRSREGSWRQIDLSSGLALWSHCRRQNHHWRSVACRGSD